MNNILALLIGALSSMVAIVFIGWFDITVMKCPSHNSENKFITYAIASAWELLFVIVGVMIGLVIGGELI